MPQTRPEDKIVTELVAARIRQRRIELNLSQEQLGHRCGLHRTYIGAVERGEKRITVVTLNRIAHALQVPLAHLVSSQSGGTL